MVILAHPDDESAVGQILAKYAREGKEVYLVIATDGRYGVTEHAGIPAGDSLAIIRKNETICAAQSLGIKSPIFLGFHDVFGLLTGISDLVTEVILREGLYEKYPLYFIAWPKEKIVAIPQGNMSSLNYVDARYRNIQIHYNKEDQSKLFKSLHCYKSQLTENEVEQWIQAELKDSTFITYFRQFKTDTTIRNSF